MKVITITKASLDAKKTIRAIKLTTREATIASIMSSYGLTYLQAVDFADSSTASREARKAERAASWLPLPQTLADSILADYNAHKADEKKDPKKFMAFRVARTAERKGEPMQAGPELTAQLQKVYGL